MSDFCGPTSCNEGLRGEDFMTSTKEAEVEPRRPTNATTIGTVAHGNRAPKLRGNGGPLEQLRASDFAPLCKGQSNLQVRLA
jgi:hypothetical protein